MELDKTIAIAESITGGSVCKMLTDVSGISAIFHYGVVSYSDEAKQKLLNVKKETLDKYTAVSPEVALEMSEGIKALSNADICVSITGEAGPKSSSGKPIGTVYIAVNNMAYKYHFEGNRAEIREKAAVKVFELLQELIDDLD